MLLYELLVLRVHADVLWRFHLRNAENRDGLVVIAVVRLDGESAAALSATTMRRRRVMMMMAYTAAAATDDENVVVVVVAFIIIIIVVIRIRMVDVVGCNNVFNRQKTNF